jgi:two-component system OmpR family response regulator
MIQKHIFVVDDNVMFAEMLKDHLSRHPAYKVSAFNTGEECLANLYQNPDLIILDFHLNDTFKDAANGLEILAEIKKQESPAHVIIISGQKRYGIAAQTISKGAEQYVIKDDNAFKNISKILKDLF